MRILARRFWEKRATLRGDLMAKLTAPIVNTLKKSLTPGADSPVDEPAPASDNSESKPVSVASHPDQAAAAASH